MIAKKLSKFCATLTFFAAFSSFAIAGEKINKVFSADTIGSNVPYLEKITGPSRNTINLKGKLKLNIYKVDGCEVAVKIADDIVQSIGIEQLSPKCTFNLNVFLPNVGGGKLPLVHKLTFGRFDSLTGDGKYTASCLQSCGNAADPEVYETWQAPRSDGNYELQIGVALVSGPALEASSKWTNEMMKSEDEDWIIDAKFNCTDKYNQVARTAFRSVKITSAVIGFRIAGDECKR